MEQIPVNPVRTTPTSAPEAASPIAVAPILAGVMLGLFLAALDGTIVGTVMPTIVSDLRGLELYTWPFAAYMICSTIAIVIFGKISDLWGRKKIFLGGIGIFLAGSALCGLAPDIVILSLFRGIQGIGGGIIITHAFIIIAEIFPLREQGRYMGLLASVFGITSIVGPVLGGLITDIAGWRWVFYINIPIGIAAIVLIGMFLHETADVPATRRIDPFGMAAFIAWIVPLFLALSLDGTAYPWTSPLVLGLLVIAAAALAVFIKIQKGTDSPLINPGLFRNRIFTICIALAFLANALFFAGIMYLPLFMQEVMGANASGSGIVITPMVVSLAIASIFSGRLISATGKYRRAILSGILVTGIGIAILTRLRPETAVTEIMISSSILGFGIGMLYPLLTVAAQNTSPPRELGAVTSSLQFARNLGAAILTPVFGFVMHAGISRGSAALPPDSVPLAGIVFGIEQVFLFCTALVAIGIILALLLEERPLRSRMGAGGQDRQDGADQK
jgi:EmrB/QacA subfamily drug resistance transporter